ncbi:MAG: MoaD/ThiS family protein [Candidatus Bathyarchaeia archaeon]
MKVKIKMMGLLKKVFGRNEVLIELNKSERTELKEVILKLIEISDALRDLLLDPELKDPRPNILVLVNGREISVLGGLEAEIRDGDEVVLIPVIHGGFSAKNFNHKFWTIDITSPYSSLFKVQKPKILRSFNQLRINLNLFSR